jgi:hypothetical protein
MEPMTMLAIGSAVAGGLSSIFGGQAQGAAIRAQNEQAYRNWIQANSQKTLNNSREQFQAAYLTAQQLKRNSSIMRAAWENEWEAKQALNYRTGFQQNQLSKQMQTQKALLMNSILNKGISSNSGMYATLALAQSIDSLKNAQMIEYNAKEERKNIDRQTSNMMSQQTDNFYMPNIQLYDQAPIFGDASAAEMGGLISGVVQIGGAVAAAGIETPKSTTTTTTPRTVSVTPTTSTSSVPTTSTSSIPYFLRR